MCSQHKETANVRSRSDTCFSFHFFQNLYFFSLLSSIHMASTRALSQLFMTVKHTQSLQMVYAMCCNEILEGQGHKIANFVTNAIVNVHAW